ncbi:hypothetical protein KKHLCK_14510 [Candidatus Electrothrix laxa]
MQIYQGKVAMRICRKVLLWFLVLTPAPLAAATIQQEEFDSCQIPVDWAAQDLLEHESGTCGWKWRVNEGFEENYTGGEGCFVLANSDECGVGTSIDTVLSMPPIDCSDLTGTNLSFKYDAYDQFETSSFAVEVSTNEGNGWTEVWKKELSDRGPQTATLDLGTVADGQPSLMIRFRYTASYEWWWQIDDVTVSADEKNKSNWILFIPAITTGTRSIP